MVLKKTKIPGAKNGGESGTGEQAINNNILALCFHP